MKEKRQQLQLSISLLVSNNIGTIKKCMESILPILESIPSELIVVDTVGKEKSDGSLAVAEKYANLVIPFQWCDDFSAARNTGLKHAKGEWFMFLDDDEWFEDVSPIIDFFKTGEYKKYGAAYYDQRNYTDFQGGKYVDSSISRIVCLRKGTHFVRPIHETYENIYGQPRYLDCFVHHYGYLYKTMEDRMKKSKRNTDLLLMHLEKDTSNMEDRIYLAREYSSIKADAKMEEELRYIVYEMPDNNPKLIRHLNWARVAYVISLCSQKKYDLAVKEGERLLSDFPFYDLAATMLYVILSEVNEILYDWEGTLKYVYQYFGKYDALDENSNSCKMQEFFEMTIKAMKLHVDGVLVRGVLSALNLNQAHDVTKILKWFWDKDADKSIVIAHIEKYKKQSKEYNRILTQALSDIDSQHSYILLNKFLACETKSKGEAQQAFDNYIVIQENNAGNMAAILKLVLKQKLNIEEFTNNVYESRWDICLKSAYSDLSLMELESFREKIKEALLHGNEIKYKVFLRILEKYILLHKAKEHKEVSWEDLTIYCSESLQNFRTIYNEVLFQDGNELNLPEDMQFIISMEKCLEFKEADKLEDCFKILKETLKKCPSMKDVLEGLFNLFQDELKERQNAEFNDIKNKLLQETMRFIDNGQKAEASMILEHLKKLLPTDETLLALEKRIKQM